MNVRPYPYLHFQKTKIEKQVEDTLRVGLIKLSHSSFSSPMLLVKKKDESWFCVDFRALNSIVVEDYFLMPIIDGLLDELKHTSWFSKLYLCHGFHQILMHSDDTPKIAFCTHQWHYEYRVTPFELCNSLPYFRRP